MKKLMFAALATAAFVSFAEEAKSDKTAEEKPAEAQQEEAPWGFAFSSWGYYSGYQLYGNLVNNEPVIQSYSEINYFLPADLGYIGVAAFLNCDMTPIRRDSLRQAFNEMDPMIHWQKTFWFDDNNTYGLTYRSWFCWYIYPDSHTDTTWDWDHKFTFENPFVTPYITWVREYTKGSNLIEFGLYKVIPVCDNLTLKPSANFVWRENRYVWCFPTAGFTRFADSGLATMRLQLDANYQICKNLSIWGTIAYCRTLDNELRDIQNDPHSTGAAYAKEGDFAWGGVGVCLSF